MPKPSLKSLLERSEGFQAPWPGTPDFTDEEQILFNWWHKLGLLERRLFERDWKPFKPTSLYHPAWQYRLKPNE